MRGARGVGAHIGGRVTAYRLAGLDEREVVTRTLRELGHPGEVSVGMVRLHTLPTLVSSSAALAAVCAVIVTLFSGGLARPLAVTDLWPSSYCLEANAKGAVPELCNSYQPWTNMATLERVLEPQGVEVREKHDNLQLVLFGDRPVYYSLDEQPFTKPNGAPLRAEQQVKRGYVPVWELLGRIADVATVRLKNSNTPTVQIGDVSLQLTANNSLDEKNKTHFRYLSETFFLGTSHHP